MRESVVGPVHESVSRTGLDLITSVTTRSDRVCMCRTISRSMRCDANGLASVAARQLKPKTMPSGITQQRSFVLCIHKLCVVLLRFPISICVPDWEFSKVGQRSFVFSR